MGRVFGGGHVFKYVLAGFGVTVILCARVMIGMKFDDKDMWGAVEGYNVFELFDMVTATVSVISALIICKYVWRLPHMGGVVVVF